MSEIDDKTLTALVEVTKARKDAGEAGSLIHNDEILGMHARIRRSEDALAAALHRAEEAEAIANLAMSEGLRAVKKSAACAECRNLDFGFDSEDDGKTAGERLEAENYELWRGLRSITHKLGADSGQGLDDDLKYAEKRISELKRTASDWEYITHPQRKSDWDEPIGQVIWWPVMANGRVYVGKPTDPDFPESLVAWTPIPEAAPFGCPFTYWCPDSDDSLHSDEWQSKEGSCAHCGYSKFPSDADWQRTALAGQNIAVQSGEALPNRACCEQDESLRAALEAIRDEDEQRFKDGVPSLSLKARARIDAALSGRTPPPS